MIKKLCFILMAWSMLSSASIAQEDTTIVELDDIQFDLKGVTIEKDTLTIDLFLISCQLTNREFKINLFGTEVADENYTEHLCHSVQIGRVYGSVDSRENYLNYLLQKHQPVLMRIKVLNWIKDFGKPKSVQIVFEDSQEIGHYRQIRIDL